MARIPRMKRPLHRQDATLEKTLCAFVVLSIKIAHFRQKILCSLFPSPFPQFAPVQILWLRLCRAASLRLLPRKLSGLTVENPAPSLLLRSQNHAESQNHGWTESGRAKSG